MIKKSGGHVRILSNIHKSLGSHPYQSQAQKRHAQVEIVKQIKNIKDKQGWHE